MATNEKAVDGLKKKYAVAMYVAMADGKPDWNQIAKELGYGSINSLRVTWGNHKKAFLQEYPALENGGTPNSDAEVKKATARKRKADNDDYPTPKPKAARNGAIKKEESSAGSVLSSSGYSDE